MKAFDIPGTAWIALLAFATTWLTQYFGDVIWVPTIIAGIGGLIKFLEMVTEKEPPAPTMPEGAMGAPMPAQEKPNPVVRWLVG